MTPLPTKQQLSKAITRLTNIIPHFHLLIDTDSLDCRWWDTCILGQIFGHFDVALIVCRMSWQDAVDEGFILNIEADNPNFDRLYKQLDELWIEILEERNQ